MQIESYSFGQIVIDGKSYDSDVIISQKGVESDWYRLEGHLLQMDDLDDVLSYSPEIVVVGSGYSGMMKVSPEVTSYFNKNGIELRITTTEKAAEILNELLEKKQSVVGAFHLTC